MTQAQLSHAPTPHPGGARRLSLVLCGLIGVWFLLMRQLGGADMYSVLGPYALAVSVVIWLLRPRALRRWLAPAPKAVLTGLAVGLTMTLLTYPVYRLFAAEWPLLAAHVSELYGAAHRQAAPLPVRLVWLPLIITAEELLFRGALLEALERKLPRLAAGALAVSIYTLAQLGAGSWVLGATALVCGAIWTAQRMLSGSVLSSLIAHLIWTPTVILLHPVS